MGLATKKLGAVICLKLISRPFKKKGIKDYTMTKLLKFDFSLTFMVLLLF